MQGQSSLQHLREPPLRSGLFQFEPDPGPIWKSAVKTP